MYRPEVSRSTQTKKSTQLCVHTHVSTIKASISARNAANSCSDLLDKLARKCLGTVLISSQCKLEIAVLETYHLRYTWPAHVFTRTSSDSSTSRSTTSSSRQPLSYDHRQSWLQEQCNFGLSPTLHWSRVNARNAAPYSFSRQCYTLLALYATSGTCPAHCQGGYYSRQKWSHKALSTG